MPNIGSYVVSIFASTIVLCWGTFVATFLWAWFAVPAFGVGPIGFFEMMGLTLLANYFMRPMTKPLTFFVASAIRTPEERNQTIYIGLFFDLLFYTAIGVIGYIIQFF